MVKRVMELVGGARRRGRPKKRWEYCVGDILVAMNIEPQATGDRQRQRQLAMERDPECNKREEKMTN